MIGRTHAGRCCVRAALLTIAALAISAQPVAAMGGGHSGGGHGGGFGGGHAGVGRHGGFAYGHGGGHFGGGVVFGGLGLWSLYGHPHYPYYYPYYASPYPYGYAQAVVPGNSVPQPTQAWYYCDAAANFYPYVTTCPVPWREVPATAAVPVPAR